jgi:hypothetical protein
MRTVAHIVHDDADSLTIGSRLPARRGLGLSVARDAAVMVDDTAALKGWTRHA